MDDSNFFAEKGLIPTDQDLIENLGTTTLWHQIKGFVLDPKRTKGMELSWKKIWVQL
jgi:hypothetical protein